MVAIRVAGVDVTCRVQVPARLVAGRRHVRELGDAGYCSFTMRRSGGDPWVSPFDAVEVEYAGRVAFAGRVTETKVDRDAAGRWWQTVECVGPLADWGGLLYHTNESWPRETVQERAERIATDVGVPLVVLGGDTVSVAQQDTDGKSARELLLELARSVGAFLFDRPADDGRPTVYFEALGARTVQVSTVTWDMEPVGETWDQLAAEVRWLDEDSSAFTPIDLSGCYVRADPGPTWASTDAITNRVRVEYDTPTKVLLHADPVSIGLYGTHDAKLETMLDDAGDAQLLAEAVLARAAYPALAFQSVDVDLSRIPVELADVLLAAAPGTRVTISDLPGGGPAGAFLGVLEGHELTVYADGALMRLYVSDVASSFAVPAWNELPVDWLWNDEPDDPAATWEVEVM